jgi:predicted alpha/beta superfamily hydrolase
VNRIGSMVNRGWLVLAAILCFTSAVSHGGIVFEGEIPSAILGKPRRIHIYTPPSYETEKARRYPVLYVHDGQNAFTTAGPGAAFGWGSWELDKTANELAQKGRVQEFIMVAIDCTNERYKEYRGPKAWRKATNQVDEIYERYEKFLIEELKPKIDREYRTKPGAKDTATIGSSMGGVVSMALAWKKPKVFGKAASLSGAFQVEDKAFLRKILKPYEGKKKATKLYLDSGSMDYTGGDDGRKDTEAVVAELRRIGWKKDLLHYVDPGLTAEQLQPYGLNEGKAKEAARSHHNEFYWRLRAWRALEFLFPPGK